MFSFFISSLSHEYRREGEYDLIRIALIKFVANSLI
jgi:hypothetical protein